MGKAVFDVRKLLILDHKLRNCSNIVKNKRKNIKIALYMNNAIYLI